MIDQYKTNCYIKKQIHPILFLFVVLTNSFCLYAQKDERSYREYADEMRKDVWGWSRPEFQNRTVPAEAAGYSKVVLARHIEISVKKKRITNLVLTEVFRELVKLNDKAAVAEYSEFEYNQMEKGSGFTAGRTTTSYLGIRIIKPDGSQREVNADNQVITANDKDKKQVKIAVPDLQPGDMIDYFIAREGIESQGFLETVSAYEFELYADHPVLNFSIHCETAPRYAIEYRAYNGAADFKTSKGGGNNIIELEQKEIPIYPGTDLWTSPYRQLPILRMNIIVGFNGVFAGRLNAREPGRLYKNQPTDEFYQDEMNNLYLWKLSEKRQKVEIPDDLKDYLKKVNHDRDKMPADSFAAEMFYILRYADFLDIQSYMDVQTIIDRTKREQSGKNYKFHVYDFLDDKGVDVNMAIPTRRTGSRKEEIMGTNELDYLIQLNGGKPKFFGTSNIFNPAFYIPYFLEGEKGVLSLDLKGGKRTNPNNFESSQVNIPVTTASQNLHWEKLEIAIADGNTDLPISRSTTLTGHFKEDIQKQLILMEDYCNAERKAFNINTTIIEEMESGKKTKSFADELRFGFSKARKEQKNSFTKEAADWFGQEILDLKDNTVTSLGVRHYQPEMVYSSKFKIPNLVKKAGPNLLIEIGKLSGPKLIIPNSDRARKIDIYMPFARMISTEFTINIPEGYVPEGLEALNKKVENEAGHFISDAKWDGHTISIKVTKIYEHAFEPGKNWDMLLAINDAANQWGELKLLLKKK